MIEKMMKEKDERTIKIGWIIKIINLLGLMAAAIALILSLVSAIKGDKFEDLKMIENTLNICLVNMLILAINIFFGEILIMGYKPKIKGNVRIYPKNDDVMDEFLEETVEMAKELDKEEKNKKKKKSTK